MEVPNFCRFLMEKTVHSKRLTNFECLFIFFKMIQITLTIIEIVNVNSVSIFKT